jgi:RNA polymerase sigma factor (sigma-70 family)
LFLVVATSILYTFIVHYLKLMPVKIKYNEEELVAHLLSKDQKRFEAIYNYFSAALLGIINQIVHSEEIAQDVLQESFIKIWNSSDSYTSAKSRLFTWMLNIARNTAIDHLRSKHGKMEKKIQSIDNFSDTVGNGGITIAKNHDHIGIKKLLSELKDEHREIIELAYFEGYTQDEISKKMNIPLGTVKTRARMALQTLRIALKL